MDLGTVLGINRSGRTWPCVKAEWGVEAGLVPFTGGEEGGAARPGVRRGHGEFCEAQEGVLQTEPQGGGLDLGSPPT